MEKSNKSRKTPVRSAMSDQELAALIRLDRQERPQEFESSVPAGGCSAARFDRIPAVTEVIARWL